MAVKAPVYRQVPTPGGIAAVEHGRVDWYSHELYANFNTGILEEYMEEKDRREGFAVSTWNWRRILIGVFLGALYAPIVQYVGLMVGIAVTSGVWYLTYLLGLGFRWKPSEVNMVSATAVAATAMSTGFIFTFPAIYLLHLKPAYFLHGEPLIRAIPFSVFPVALISSILAGWLGAAYFIIFRRLWIVEDPLPMPGFEATVKLLEICNELTRGAVESARRSLRVVLAWTGATAVFTFLRDWPLYAKKSLLDMFMGGDFYSGGHLSAGARETARYTWVSFGITPILIALGWFMRFRTALLVCSGSFLTWFVVVPLAVGFDVPIFMAGTMVGLGSVPGAAWTAFASVARPIAIGAILGGGLTALFKMLPAFIAIFRDIREARASAAGGKGRGDYIRGKGWFEWPVLHIPLLMAVVFAGVAVAFIAGGFPPGPSALFAIVLVGCTFFIGAIAVKIMGEVGTEPVSGTSFIVLMLLLGLFLLLGIGKETIALITLLGTTVFASAITMSGNIIGDFKAGHYIGNRPYHLSKAVFTAVAPGAFTAVVSASFFSYLLATGQREIPAPQANAFAYMVQIVVGGQTNNMLIQYLAAGFVIGMLVDLLTGMGTAFGLGMYFPLYTTLPWLLGGALRDLWQRSLDRRAKAERWPEQARTLKLLNTYMAATGLLMGESIMGIVVALYIVFGAG